MTVTAWILVISFGAAALCWLLCEWAHRRTLRRVEASQSWPAAPGTVVAAQLVPYQSEMGPGEYARIIYTYSVEGKSFEGDRIHADSMQGRGAEATLAAYPVGASLTVYYNPANPKEAVLERGGGSTDLRKLGVIVAALIAGVGLLFAGMWIWA